ncbi:MAG: patatin-like phospholipase family protein [Anaerolinea sp.]|nr:patatin-like phospholipase family protein [Anaerolinea sp.]
MLDEPEKKVDLVFEGGGAKGMVLIGALEVLFGAGYSPGRLLGTSAGAITALALAAGYTIPELNAALSEKDEQGKPIFTTFLGDPPVLDAAAIGRSAIRTLLAEINMSLVWDPVEKRLDDRIVNHLAGSVWGRHLFSFLELGGLFSAECFISWATEKLNSGEVNGTPRRFGDLTLKEFFDQTQVELTLVAADTTWSRALWLNHRTAPDCPVVYAARMSMSVPFIWPEIEWQEEWGSYHTWNPATRQLEPIDIAGHMVVDGGVLSNFPIALFLADSPDVTAVVGQATTRNVLGLLIDESLQVPNRPERQNTFPPFLSKLSFVDRLKRLVNTATGAHDNLAKALYKANVVRLPAGGYETTQFGMSDKEREALVNAGREAMIAFLGISPAGGATPAMPGLPAFDSGTIASPNFAISDPLAVDYANNAAANLLGQQ